MFKTAVIQMNSNDNIDSNFKTALALTNSAVRNNAQFIVLPENFLYIGKDKSVGFDESCDYINQLRKTAYDKKVFICAGSFPETTNKPNKHYNTTLLINSQGEIISKYRKIHLFDININDSQETSESTYTIAGENVVTVKTSFGTIGFAICYDLRFGELFKKLTLMGAQIIVVPSNFMFHTGKDHWEILLRARAIENGIFIIAPNQTGIKYDGNRSYGHSLIISPWGAPLAKASFDNNEIIYADIDMANIKTVREKIPSIKHIKIFKLKN
ncbi:carbon-nitrogen hydrolase family protein [bacterium]|nr:carbon-nitrogen hydrolase family protein [bacterium]